MNRILIALFMAALASGCATARKSGFEDQKFDNISGHKTEFKNAADKKTFEEAKALWAKRDDKASLEKALAKFEQLNNSNPGTYEVLMYLCRGYYLYADGHLDDKKAKIKNWEKGTGFGEKAMAVNTSFRKKVIEDKAAIEDALDVLTPGEVDAIYWTAVNLGKWAKLEGVATTLKYKGRVKKMIERVQEFSPEFFYGAPHRYWAVYYAVAPFFAGGSMEKSEVSFKKALSVENNYFATHVLYAENFAIKKGDKELFKEQLEWVLKQNPNVIPDIAPENTIEQRKAKAMLENIENHF